jgi:2,6-dihydroxypseudooxynicotine hydrolase
VQIPFEDGHFAAILRKPQGIARPPVVVMVPGLDSAKEEMESYELPFLARGMATLLVDGPGQGESEYRFAIRGDYETAVKAMFDWVAMQRDIDAERTGLWGVSLGGYYAARAAAFEKRVRACVSLSGPFDWGDCWDMLPPLTRDAFRVRSHLQNEAEARAYASTLTLKGVARQIECPLFVVAGKLDRIVPWQDGARLAAEASGPVELLMIDDAGHNANNRPYRYRTRTADWMAEQLTTQRAQIRAFES